ncbi:uncharacterized protein DS421_12g377400 [Arachis hypogaea]|nr:uncharacterized protein DS421_12g377400 [Arachis hypogaea]
MSLPLLWLEHNSAVFSFTAATIDYSITVGGDHCASIVAAKNYCSRGKQFLYWCYILQKEKTLNPNVSYYREYHCHHLSWHRYY